MTEKAYMLRMTEDLHRQVKLQAVAEGVTLNDLIVAALQEYLKKKGGK